MIQVNFQLIEQNRPKFECFRFRIRSCPVSQGFVNYYTNWVDVEVTKELKLAKSFKQQLPPLQTNVSEMLFVLETQAINSEIFQNMVYTQLTPGKQVDILLMKCKFKADFQTIPSDKERVFSFVSVQMPVVSQELLLFADYSLQIISKHQTAEIICRRQPNSPNFVSRENIFVPFSEYVTIKIFGLIAMEQIQQNFYLYIELLTMTSADIRVLQFNAGSEFQMAIQFLIPDFDIVTLSFLHDSRDLNVLPHRAEFLQNTYQTGQFVKAVITRDKSMFKSNLSYLEKLYKGKVKDEYNRYVQCSFYVSNQPFVDLSVRQKSLFVMPVETQLTQKLALNLQPLRKALDFNNLATQGAILMCNIYEQDESNAQYQIQLELLQQDHQNQQQTFNNVILLQLQNSNNDISKEFAAALSSKYQEYQSRINQYSSAPILKITSSSDNLQLSQVESLVKSKFIFINYFQNYISPDDIYNLQEEEKMKFFQSQMQALKHQNAIIRLNVLFPDRVEQLDIELNPLLEKLIDNYQQYQCTVFDIKTESGIILTICLAPAGVLEKLLENGNVYGQTAEDFIKDKQQKQQSIIRQSMASNLQLDYKLFSNSASQLAEHSIINGQNQYQKKQGTTLLADTSVINIKERQPPPYIPPSGMQTLVAQTTILDIQNEDVRQQITYQQLNQNFEQLQTLRQVFNDNAKEIYQLKKQIKECNPETGIKNTEPSSIINGVIKEQQLRLLNYYLNIDLDVTMNYETAHLIRELAKKAKPEDLIKGLTLMSQELQVGAKQIGNGNKTAANDLNVLIVEQEQLIQSMEAQLFELIAGLQGKDFVRSVIQESFVGGNASQQEVTNYLSSVLFE